MPDTLARTLAVTRAAPPPPPPPPRALAHTTPDPWQPGLFIGGPLDGELGPTSGDRYAMVRGGRVHRYSPVTRQTPHGRELQTWLFVGVAELD